MIYYVATDGSGDFTTIAQVNAATFVAGDEVLFRRGDTWREQLIPDSGSASGYITYGAYGTGAKPLLLGSKQENLLPDWVDEGANIWSNNDSSFTIDVGNLIFDNEASVGVKCWLESDLDTQDEFWYDETNDLIKVYSVGNPASVHSNIECALMKDIFDGSPDYIVIENLDLRYGARHGIGFSSGQSNIIVRDCEFYFIGGGDQYGGDSTIRLGNAIEFYENMDNILVERCLMKDIYDEAITAQGQNGNISNVIFRNNVFSDTRVGITIYLGTSGNISDVYIYNNTCLFGDGGWQIDQMTGTGSHLIGLQSNANVVIENEVVKNNILYSSVNNFPNNLFIVQYQDVSGLIVDNNIYYRNDTKGVVHWKGAGYNMSQFAAYQLATGQDAHSIVADPLLTDTYRLRKGSPAINAGTDVGVEEDYFGNKRVGTPDIGACEYVRRINHGNFNKGNSN